MIADTFHSSVYYHYHHHHHQSTPRSRSGRLIYRNKKKHLEAEEIAQALAHNPSSAVQNSGNGFEPDTVW